MTDLKEDKLKIISEFQGKYRFLSNFWPAKVTLDNIEYPSVEHAYQAAKTLDKSYRQKIFNCKSPGEAKRLGKRSPLRGDWEEVKISIMTELLTQKFSHKHLELLLLETGEADLIEGNTWGDIYWGVCRGTGKNYLGKILVTLRETLKTKRKKEDD